MQVTNPGFNECITMKAIFLTVILLFGVSATVRAQTDFSKALVTRRTNDIPTLSTEAYARDVIHREFVLWTVQIARRENISFDQEAANVLDELYAKKSDLASAASLEEKTSLPANTRRFVFRLFSYAKVNPDGTGVITKASIQELLSDLDIAVKNNLKGFCPCFPWC